MKLLALDTSSAQCSVALLIDGELRFRTVATARDHARLLLPMVDALLAEAGLGLGGLAGIAFGRGPGSFTGLRIAAAVTQGLAAGAQLPVLPVSSLRALAAQAQRLARDAQGAPPAGAVLACMDARMNEVYWGLYPGTLAPAGERLTAPEQLQGLGSAGVALAAGRALAAWPCIAESLQLPAARLFADAEPHARDVAAVASLDLAQGASWLDPALAQPVYLRDQVIQSPREL